MTIDELVAKLNNFQTDLPNIIRSVEAVTSQKALELLKSRLFRAGATDSLGNLLPNYNPGYAKKKGKTSATWDLQDTGSLKLGIQVGFKGDRIVMGFVSNERNLEVEEDLERRHGESKPGAGIIFALSTEEKAEIIKTGEQYLTKELSKL